VPGRSQIVLGTKPGQHDACFALVRDGEPLFIYEQERFNRVKHGMSSHLAVLFEALEEHSIAPRDIDLVTNCMDPGRLPERRRQVRRYLSGPAATAMDDHLAWRLPTWHRLLEAAGFGPERVVDLRHHICHAAGVYYASPYDDAAILSVDGSGETETALLAHGRRGEIQVLRTIPHPHSLGHFYQAATFWLGWGFGEEGKTMALAAHGDPGRWRKSLDEIIEVDEQGRFRFADVDGGRSFPYTSRGLADTVFTRAFGPGRRDDEELSELHKDVAAGVQQICEEVMLRSARFLRGETGAKVLLLAGGVGLNSVSNGLILESGLFDQVVAYPQANDAGTALGGALHAHHHLGGAPRRRWHMTHACWGREIDRHDLDRAARHHGVRGAQVDDVVGVAAEILASGRIVGWVQGRAEIGPRALGNRSILADPLAPGIKDRVNERVKHRETWRPFAPSVLREDLAEYFDADHDLPYMTVVVRVRAAWRGRLSSVCHVDGTARVQTVTRESNPRFHALLVAMKQRTGLGMLLNTSLNDRGEPLVQTCDQALELFLRSEMDALVLGDHVFVDKPATADVPDFSPHRWNFAKLPRTPLLFVADAPTPATERTLSRLRDLHPRVEMADGWAAATALAGDFGGVVHLSEHSADEFAFDPAVYGSKTADLSRALMEETGTPVLWIDRYGDVVPMQDVLYVHHSQDERRRCPVASTYDRYWLRGC
jgi:predicted NodU family carbamoyl transferase